MSNRGPNPSESLIEEIMRECCLSAADADNEEVVAGFYAWLKARQEKFRGALTYLRSERHDLHYAVLVSPTAALCDDFAKACVALASAEEHLMMLDDYLDDLEETPTLETTHPTGLLLWKIYRETLRHIGP